jgi:hypothetical protein
MAHIETSAAQLKSRMRIHVWLAMALIFFAGLLVYLPGMSGDFIYDDNIEVRNVDDVFTPGAWPKLFLNAYQRLYRPVKLLSFYVDNALFGWHPLGWHWQSDLWHAGNGVLVFLLARRLNASLFAACISGLWFAIHPIHTEAVVWVNGRGTLMSTFGVLAMLLFYERWRRAPVGWALAGMLTAGFIGFFSKEDALMVFPLIGLYEIFIRREKIPVLLVQKSFLTAVLALGGLAAVYVILRQSIISGVKQGNWGGGFSGWISTLPVILVTYLRQLIWPDPMCVDQPVDYTIGFGPVFWLSVLVLAACGCFLFFRRGAWSPWQFALAFFFIALIPVMGLIPINQPRADRFLYLPSVAGALALAWLWDVLAGRLRWRPLYIAFLAASFAWYGWRSWDYSKTFLNETVLWQNALATNPQSYRCYGNLAAIDNNTGHAQQALPLVEKALELNPGYPEGLVVKAYALEMLGRTSEAETYYVQAIAKGGEDPRWLYLLADLLTRDGKPAQAEKYYDRIAELRPNYTEARYAAGILALQMNKPDKAQADMTAVLQADPGNQKARDILQILRHPQVGPMGK